MTLKEMQVRVLALIEELNPDYIDQLKDDEDIEDIMLKINPIIDQIQNEVSRHKKIPAKSMQELNDKILNVNSIPMFYQLNKILDVTYELINDEIIFDLEDLGKTINIYYYKFPNPITKENEDNYEFELTQDSLNIIPYGVAADILKNDRIANYGRAYKDEYIRLLQMLDPRLQSSGAIVIDGGYDV